MLNDGQVFSFLRPQLVQAKRWEELVAKILEVPAEISSGFTSDSNKFDPLTALTMFQLGHKTQFCAQLLVVCDINSRRP